MKSLHLLLQGPPPWVQLGNRRADGTDILATPPPPGGGPARSFHLELGTSSQGGVCVMEQKSRQQFPTFCLERHINPDSSFCLHFGSEAKLDDNDAVAFWWSSLGSFLINR